MSFAMHYHSEYWPGELETRVLIAFSCPWLLCEGLRQQRQSLWGLGPFLSYRGIHRGRTMWKDPICTDPKRMVGAHAWGYRYGQGVQNGMSPPSSFLLFPPPVTRDTY